MYTKNSFYKQAMPQWNSLEKDTAHITTVNSCKSRPSESIGL